MPPQENDRRLDSRMIVPEARADQFYGGFGRISSNGIPPNNNAMEIMSRFRPIAPKPCNPKPGESAGSAPSDPKSTSTLSFDRSSGGGKAVSSERSRGKRNRKRSEPLLPPTQRQKRGQTSSKPRAVLCDGPAASAGGIQKAVEEFDTDKSGVQPILPIPSGAEYAQLKGGASNGSHDAELVSIDYSRHRLQDHVDGSLFDDWGTLVYSKPDRRKFSNGFGAFKMPQVSTEWVCVRGGGSLQDAGATPANEGSVAKEPDFMSRAAAASYTQPSGREVNGVQKTKGGYDRGFECYPKCEQDGGPYRQATPSSPVDVISDSAPRPANGNDNWTMGQISHDRSNGNSELASDGNSRERDLVTLPLLPDTPSQGTNSSQRNNSSPSSYSLGKLDDSNSIPCLKLSLMSDTRDWNEAQAESLEELNLRSLSRDADEERRNGFGTPDRRDQSRGKASSSSETAERVVEDPPLERRPRGSGSGRESEDGGGAVVTDSAHMEQQYSASSDPMMLSGVVSGEILWTNPAYVKADAERKQRRLGKAKEAAGAPYLDVLGIPTKLSTFDFLTAEGSRTKGDLWGFLKKFMTSDRSNPAEGGTL